MYSTMYSAKYTIPLPLGPIRYRVISVVSYSPFFFSSMPQTPPPVRPSIYSGSPSYLWALNASIRYGRNPSDVCGYGASIRYVCNPSIRSRCIPSFHLLQKYVHAVYIR